MNYKKINKPTARKMYNRGFSIQLLPCRCRFSDEYNTWFVPFITDITKSTEDCNKFDRMVSSFEYYNCNAELGYYAHYYVTEEDYNKFKEELSHEKY